MPTPPNGTLLNSSLRLGEIESAELFCRQVLDDRLRQFGAYLNVNEYDDALSFLIAEAWLLWQDLTLEQVARRFGYGRRWSREGLDRLRSELEPMLYDRNGDEPRDNGRA
jgi:hypothetical protein